VSIVDTTITLAPLLCLLGKVTGIMGSFSFVGNADLAPTKVSGGIAEALIATACGLGIAIFTLIFFNFSNSKLENLHFELQSTSHNLILVLNSLRAKNNLGVEQHARQPQQFVRTQLKEPGSSSSPRSISWFSWSLPLCWLNLAMITMKGIDVNLPAATSAQPNTKPKFMMVSIDACGSCCTYGQDKPYYLVT
jgi:hypothetical protein